MNKLPDKIKNQKRIEIELDKLKIRFNYGYELKLMYLPEKSRINDYGISLSGEIQNNFVLIYDSDPDKALETLRHEFIEYILSPIIKQYVDVINNQNEIIAKLLKVKREEVVEQLRKGLEKDIKKSI